MDYRISLWNYYHYANQPNLERVAQELRQAGFGIELWPRWQGEQNIYCELYKESVKCALRGMKISLHSGGARTFEENRTQIDFASHIGADNIVVHLPNLRLGEGKPDYSFAKDVVDYADSQGITIALENGPLRPLVSAIENIENLKICIDTGHIYFTDHSMKDYVDALRERVVHLHLQDTLEESDHYILGTGIIPIQDWEYLWSVLEEDGFTGACVFEIRPRSVLLSAHTSIRFLNSIRVLGS